MNIAYIITVYHKPEQLTRLIRNLNTENTWFYIHLDKTKPIGLFRASFKEIAGMAKVRFLDREDSRWGRWGFTKAFINGMLEVERERVSFDYIITLSGQDQPIKTNQYISGFLENNLGKNFLEHFALPTSEWNNGGMDRLEHYHFDFLGKEYAYPPKKIIKNYRDRILNRLYSWYFDLPRKFPENLKPYGGSCWFGITGNTVKYILNYLDEHPEYLKFHKYTYLPDEIFFQTILLNSKDDRILSSIINQNLTYLEWKGEAQIIVFTYKDYHKLATNDKLYARKFDLEIDADILSRIENNLLYKKINSKSIDY